MEFLVDLLEFRILLVDEPIEPCARSVSCARGKLQDSIKAVVFASNVFIWFPSIWWSPVGGAMMGGRRDGRILTDGGRPMPFFLHSEQRAEISSKKKTI